MRPISFLSAMLACCILGFLGLVTLFDLFDGPGTDNQERVAKTPKTPQNLAQLPRFLGQAISHVNKRYAFKNRFVTLNSTVKLAVFGHSTAVNVDLGRDGFLFLTNNGTDVITQGQDRMDSGQSADWQSHFQETNEVFTAGGMDYAMIIGPNKHSIYPEKLPRWLSPSDLSDTRTADLIAAGKVVFGDRFVDTRAVLTRARANQPGTLLHHPTDTHWTEYGAALVVHEVLGQMGLDLEPPEFEVMDVPHSGDLARMIGQKQRWSARAPVLPDEWQCRDAEGAALKIVTIDTPLPLRFTCGSEGGRPETIVVFHDSFGVPTIPYLAARFQQVEFIWNDVADPIQAAELGADYVLQVLVERKMTTHTPEQFVNLPH